MQGTHATQVVLSSPRSAHSRQKSIEDVRTHPTSGPAPSPVPALQEREDGNKWCTTSGNGNCENIIRQLLNAKARFVYLDMPRLLRNSRAGKIARPHLLRSRPPTVATFSDCSPHCPFTWRVLARPSLSLGATSSGFSSVSLSCVPHTEQSVPSISKECTEDTTTAPRSDSAGTRGQTREKRRKSTSKESPLPTSSIAGDDPSSRQLMLLSQDSPVCDQGDGRGLARQDSAGL